DAGGVDFHRYHGVFLLPLLRAWPLCIYRRKGAADAEDVNRPLLASPAALWLAIGLNPLSEWSPSRMSTVCTLSRRTFLLGATAALAGCTTAQTAALKAPVPQKVSYPIVPASDEELAARYAAVEDGGHLIPAIPYRQIDPKYYRQRVKDPTGEPAGTVVVDTPGRFLYVVEPGGTAMRYGVGIGREGFAWEGEGIIHWRQPWP